METVQLFYNIIVCFPGKRISDWPARLLWAAAHPAIRRFYISISLELLLAVYYLFDVKLGQSEYFTLIDFIELPSLIFDLFILFKNSGIKEHNG